MGKFLKDCNSRVNGLAGRAKKLSEVGDVYGAIQVTNAPERMKRLEARDDINALLLEVGERRHKNLDVGFTSFLGQSFVRPVSSLASKMMPPCY